MISTDNDLNLERILERFPMGPLRTPGRDPRGARLGAGWAPAMAAGRNRGPDGGGDDQLIGAKTGEYVVNADSARQFGYGNLDRINNMGGGDIHATTYGPGSPGATPADMREYIGSYDNPLQQGDIAVNRFNPWGVRAGPNSYFRGRHVADYTADWVPKNTVDTYYPPPPGYGVQPQSYQAGGRVGDGRRLDPEVEDYLRRINFDDYRNQKWDESMALDERMYDRGLFQGFEPRYEPSLNEPFYAREWGPNEPMSRGMPMFARAYAGGGRVGRRGGRGGGMATYQSAYDPNPNFYGGGGGGGGGNVAVNPYLDADYFYNGPNADFDNPFGSNPTSWEPPFPSWPNPPSVPPPAYQDPDTSNPTVPQYPGGGGRGGGGGYDPGFEGVGGGGFEPLSGAGVGTIGMGGSLGPISGFQGTSTGDYYRPFWANR